jgi:hypothetical protein
VESLTSVVSKKTAENIWRHFHAEQTADAGVAVAVEPVED